LEQQILKNFPTDKSGQRIRKILPIRWFRLGGIIRWSSSISWGIKLLEFFSEPALPGL
jgi:hypothetical protein